MPQTIEQRLREVVKRYNRLSPTTRRAVWVLLAFEAVLIIVAQRDIQRRPAERIRGPKLLWRAVATLNVIGPAAYYAFGRRGGR
jgi:Phospholipase_D-nuclease N-terminal